MSVLKCFAVLAPTSLVGIAVGGSLCSIFNVTELTPPVLAVLATGSLLATGVGTVILHRLIILPHIIAVKTAATVEAASAVRLESHRRLRHDIRGALSPALLTADRLLSNADPAVQRAGDIVVRAVERAAALLTDPPQTGPTPPGHP